MIKHFYNRISVSHLSNNNGTEKIISERLARQLAESITAATMKKTKEEFHSVYEMNVIVATEDDFYRAVAEFQHKAATGYPMTIDELSVK